MLKRFLHGRIDAMAGSYGYDAGYMHEILAASTLAFLKFGLFQIMSDHRDRLPKDAWYAAKLAAALSEDCGPCSQLVVDMALRDGVASSSIAALLRDDMSGAGADAALGFRSGHAVARNGVDCVALAEEAEKRFGKRGLVSLDFAVACSRVYPTLKRGLGHGAACTKITVSNETIAMKNAA
jgi:hypothetical protein